jgi:hypothetical protein
MASEIEGGRSVEHIQQRFLTKSSDRRMEKTRPNRAIRFDHCRNPRGVAARRRSVIPSKPRPEVAHDAPKFFR